MSKWPRMKTRKETPLGSKIVAALFIIIIGALATGALVVTLAHARPAVSLNFLEYRRWPHGVMLRLTNGTETTIEYCAEKDGGRPVFLSKAADGKIRRIDDVFTMPSLRPGKALDSFVSLEPDSPPVRVGIVCNIPLPPQTRVTSKLQPWLFRVKGWLGFKTAPPGQEEVWCSKSLLIGSSKQPPAGR